MISIKDYNDLNTELRDTYDIEKREVFFWGAFMLESLELLSKLKLTSVELRTLLFLCSKIGTDDNIVYIKQTTISKELNLDKSNLSKAIKNLKQLGLIVKVTNGYMINPNLIYKGKKEMRKIREMHKFFEEKMDYDPDKTLEFGFYQKIR